MSSGSLFSAFVCLFTSAAGAGLLSYPQATMNQGLVLNILLTLTFAYLNGFTNLVLTQTAHYFRERLKYGTLYIYVFIYT